MLDLNKPIYHIIVDDSLGEVCPILLFSNNELHLEGMVDDPNFLENLNDPLSLKIETHLPCEDIVGCLTSPSVCALDILHYHTITETNVEKLIDRVNVLAEARRNNITPNLNIKHSSSLGHYDAAYLLKRHYSPDVILNPNLFHSVVEPAIKFQILTFGMVAIAKRGIILNDEQELWATEQLNFIMENNLKSWHPTLKSHLRRFVTNLKTPRASIFSLMAPLLQYK